MGRNPRVLGAVAALIVAASLAQTFAFTSMADESWDTSATVDSSQTQQATPDQQQAGGSAQIPDSGDTNDNTGADGNVDDNATSTDTGDSAQGGPRNETSHGSGADGLYLKDDGSKPDVTYVGWVLRDGVRYWYDHGNIVKNKRIYVARDKATYQLDGQGRMVLGEYYDSATRSWYYFSKRNGHMLTGMIRIAAPNGGKWVFYDFNTGAMAHGERYLDYDRAHTGWYLFDRYTGARMTGWQLLEGRRWVYYGSDGRMLKGERYIDGGWYYLNDITGERLYGWQTVKGKDVFYDRATGRMVHGARMIDGRPYYFDDYTGRRFTRADLINRLLAQARSSYGKNIDAPGILAANGGLICPFGPCMSWVWWVFHESGLGIFLADGAASGWPHHNFDWYRTRGRVSMQAQVGDIAFYKWPGWADAYSASHAAIVVSVNGGRVTVADAMAGGIWERPSYTYVLVGYAHPYWD